MSGHRESTTLGRVAALVGPKQVAIKEFEVEDPGAGAVLVRVRRANVCGSELHIWRFHHPLIKQCVLGHEFVGEVVALGDGVTTDYAGQPVKLGDRVVAAYFLTCQHCPACLRGDFNLCQRAYSFWSLPPETAPHFTGAFGTHYYIQPNQHFYKVQDSLDDAVVAGANCGLSEVLYGLDRTGLRAGDSLVVQGAGGLGLYAAAVGRDMGARVIVVEGIPERIELARRFGAHEIVDLGQSRTLEERVEQVKALTGGWGADVVIEVAGVPQAFVEALHLVRPGGSVAEIGNVNVGEAHQTPLAPGLITRKAIRVSGFVRYQPWYLHRALALLERRQAEHPFAGLSDREYSLEEVAEALSATESKKVARPAILPGA